MRDINTMGKFMYIFENVAFSYLAVKIYGIYLFVNLFNFDSLTSTGILIISMIVFVVIGVILTIQHRRNSLSTAINIALPLSLYAVCGYFRYDYIGWLVVGLLAFSILVSVTYVVMTRQYSKSKASKKNKRFSLSRFSFLGVRTIVTACCSILIVFLFGTTVTGNQLYKPSLDAATTSIDYSDCLNKNRNTILLLKNSNWKKLDNIQKLNVLQTVCNIECSKLGIKDPIYVKSKPFLNEFLGCYNNDNHTILINTKHLEEDNSWDILETNFHEIFHGYEYSMIELFDSVNDNQKKLYVFSNVKQWKQEFFNYKGGECYDDYYYQNVETDSRRYAQLEVKVYKGIISEAKKK